MPNLTKRIQNVAHEERLWKKGDRIIVGVSGGPDSMCLLDLLNSISKKQSLELVIAHVDYNLRGKDSQKDQELVEKTAEKMGVPIRILEKKAGGKSNLEEVCRKIRYDFFEKILAQEKADRIAVAHNQDDQAETFLMRIIRGSGLQGLSAMRYRNGKIIRPLLGTSRKEIIEHLKGKKIAYRMDKTNLESLQTRNRIRNKLIPFIEKNFNPNIKKTLFQASLSIASDYASLQKGTAGRAGALSAKKLLALSDSALATILRREIEREKGNLLGIGARNIKEIVKMLRSDKNKSQKIAFKGLKVEKKGDKVAISKL